MKHSIRNRIRITKTGKIMRRHMGIGHNQSKKSGKQKLQNRKSLNVNSADMKMFKKYL